MSHDLRTPVNHILSYAQLAIEEADEQGLALIGESIRALATTSRRALGLIAAAVDTGSGAADSREAREALRGLAHDTVSEATGLSAMTAAQGHAAIAADLSR